MKNIIVWFRKDLRLHDNPALWQASIEGNVIPVFIWSEEEEQGYQSDSAALAWLHRSLEALEAQLEEAGLTLIYRSGNSLEILQALSEEVEAEKVYYNKRYEPWIVNRDMQVNDALSAQGLIVESFESYLLFNPDTILTTEDNQYKVFTPYYKRVLQEHVPRPVPYPELRKSSPAKLANKLLTSLNLLPTPRYDRKFDRYWLPGEKGAIKQFERFESDGLAHYETGRDIPSEASVSLLSPYLTWGSISVRAVWYAVSREAEERPEIASSVEAFKRQLVWRDFAYYQLIHFPKIIEKPLRPQFEAFPWLDDEDTFTTWKKGMTGYPLVDAGMRQLMETGIIHNRVRMVVASFLIKHLLINWTHGYDWFKETLVDFDPANNAMGWQWVAGSGVETAPYFRIFNPILQSERFDRSGQYVKEWVPELQDLPAKYIHQPWEAPAEVLAKANIELGVDYPEPIIEHPVARKRALRAFEEIKNN